MRPHPQLGPFLHNLRHAIESEYDLRIDRVLDPERAVLVEGRDALSERHEVWASRVGRRVDEFDDRILGGPGVPRGKGIAFGDRMPGEAEHSRPAEHKRRKLSTTQVHLSPSSEA